MKIKRQYLMVIGGILVVLLVASLIFFRGKGNQQKLTGAPEPTEAVIPTIDNSVKVDLTSTLGGKEILLTIKSIPTGTQTIDYELSYQTRQQGLQGVIGTITLDKESSYEKRITLGTCSSGKCVYHEVLGKVKLTLKFTGDYGDKIFEKEYEL